VAQQLTSTSGWRTWTKRTWTTHEQGSNLAVHDTGSPRVLLTYVPPVLAMTVHCHGAGMAHWHGPCAAASHRHDARRCAGLELCSREGRSGGSADAEVKLEAVRRRSLGLVHDAGVVDREVERHVHRQERGRTAAHRRRGPTPERRGPAPGRARPRLGGPCGCARRRRPRSSACGKPGRRSRSRLPSKRAGRLEAHTSTARPRARPA